ncbi:putative Late nodulin [Medicago truncatula]|uniref:Nodule Cysteine-Rich (NCR) secreted peptide n=1 Tax=Medicago truncatula TaxID=3880 RepID=A0A072U1H1_MEDTR|nr:Nodule Cysteine-Rich (NCR) secreted peptide [Medicago truncatula]RHN46200.1 putative Late nodulin [Medicago truncatula]
MAEIFKFFYTIVILVSLFFVIANSRGIRPGRECVSDYDCYIKYTILWKYNNVCTKGVCYTLLDAVHP